MLARYVDITKFLSLIKNSQIFFCRLDKLEDRFEGTMPKPTHNGIVEWFKYARDQRNYFTNPPSDEDILKDATEHLEFLNKMRPLWCINCWNEFEGESYALWKIYSDLNQGIMLKSSFSKIIDAFGDSPEEIYCSRTKYIDYDKDRIDFGNAMSPVIHKHNAYRYEKEIRLIHKVSDKHFVHDWDAEPISNGVMVDVKIVSLIEEIVISPFAPDWFKDIVEDLLDKYSLNCKLVESSFK